MYSSFILLCAVSTYIVRSGDITCQSGSCGWTQPSEVNCEDAHPGEECNVYCTDSGTAGCGWKLIVCPTGNRCNIYCNQQQSCENMQVDAQASSSVYVYANTQNAFQWGELNCPVNGHCDLFCNGRYSCNTAKVYGENARTLNFECLSGTSSDYACGWMDITCPRGDPANNECVIYDHSATPLKEAKIRTLNGFADADITCSGSCNVYNAELFCGASSSCRINAPGSGCSPSGVCDSQPTTTRAPTQRPTTQAPTTQTPTTRAPTTTSPTTAEPTTSAPTTQAPTTQAPTTNAPTTNAPTQSSTEMTTIVSTLASSSSSSTNSGSLGATVAPTSSNDMNDRQVADTVSTTESVIATEAANTTSQEFALSKTVIGLIALVACVCCAFAVFVVLCMFKRNKKQQEEIQSLASALKTQQRSVEDMAGKLKALPQNQPVYGYQNGIPPPPRQQSQPMHPHPHPPYAIDLALPGFPALPHSNSVRSGKQEKGESTPRSPTINEAEGEVNQPHQTNGSPPVVVKARSVFQHVRVTPNAKAGNGDVRKSDEHDPELSRSENSSVAMYEDHYAVMKVTNMQGIDDANKLDIFQFDDNGQQNAEHIMSAPVTKGKYKD